MEVIGHDDLLSVGDVRCEPTSLMRAELPGRPRCSQTDPSAERPVAGAEAGLVPALASRFAPSSTLIYTIAHSQLARYHHRGTVERRALQRLGLQAPAVSDDEHERIEAKAGLNAMRAELVDAARELSVEVRVALWLRVVDELPYREIAQRLDITEEVARARVSRALRTLTPITWTQEALS